VREGEHHFVAFVSGIPPEDLPSFVSKASQVINLVPTRRSSLQLIQEQIQRAVLK
jgi:hypothetical protein